jgi:hypothetical protein
MSEVYGWDCTGCTAGLQLTIEAASEGCPVDYPERCGGKLTPRPRRACRLSEDECARRCTGKPGGCDTYGSGLASDGRVNTGCSRTVVQGEGGAVCVELEIHSEAGP